MNARSVREFVGYAWAEDGPRIDFTIEAVTLAHAERQARARFGEGYAISIWNEADARRAR